MKVQRTEPNNDGSPTGNRRGPYLVRGASRLEIRADHALCGSKTLGVQLRERRAASPGLPVALETWKQGAAMRALVAVIGVLFLIGSHVVEAQNTCAGRPQWLVVTVVRIGMMMVDDPPVVPLDSTFLSSDRVDGSLSPIGRRAVPACEVAGFVQWGTGARIETKLTDNVFQLLFVLESVDDICAALNCAAAGAENPNRGDVPPVDRR